MWASQDAPSGTVCLHISVFPVCSSGAHPPIHHGIVCVCPTALPPSILLSAPPPHSTVGPTSTCRVTCLPGPLPPAQTLTGFPVVYLSRGSYINKQCALNSPTRIRLLVMYNNITCQACHPPPPVWCRLLVSLRTSNQKWVVWVTQPSYDREEDQPGSISCSNCFSDRLRWGNWLQVSGCPLPHFLSSGLLKPAAEQNDVVTDTHGDTFLASSLSLSLVGKLSSPCGFSGPGKRKDVWNHSIVSPGTSKLQQYGSVRAR